MSDLKKINNQQGVATLAVISSILIMVALFSFAVMRTGANEIKKIQNLVVNSQQKSQAIASVECAAALYMQKKLDARNVAINEFDQCKSHEGVQLSLIEKEDYWLLNANFEQATANRIIDYRKPNLALFQISGNVEIKQGNNWKVAIGDEVKINQTDYVECFTLFATGDVTIDLIGSTQNFISETNSTPCLPSYQTKVLAGNVQASNFNLDIKEQQTDLVIFRDLFEKEKNDWQLIRDEFEQIITTGSAIDSVNEVQQCGNQIKTAIDSGKELIWIEGDCLFDGLSNTGALNQTPIIVIKNGILGASESIENVKATIIQLHIGYSINEVERSWGITTDNQCNFGAMQNLCNILKSKINLTRWKHLPFYFANKLGLHGSYHVDIQLSHALIDTEFALTFDSNTLEHELVKGLPKVLRGSFHDF